jgi:phosphoribosylformylglycinamidine cyclo-ligase
MSSSKTVSAYEKSGVNRKRADLLVEAIKVRSKRSVSKLPASLRARMKSGVGGYAALLKMPGNGSDTRYLAATTDGVGTKLKLAQEVGSLETLGIDLVAMSVNDLLCVGATPLLFLDYMAVGKLSLRESKSLLEGIFQGCEEAQVWLAGGETAEMPGVYAPGEFDLAGFAIGEVTDSSLLPRRNAQVGDVLLGVRSSGFHSNGFSLLRKVLKKLSPRERNRMSQRWLTPTKIYTQAVERMTPLLGDHLIGWAHITGSGYLNLPRIPCRGTFQLDLGRKLPEDYRMLRTVEGVHTRECLKTFNGGYGLVGIVRSRKLAEKAVSIGEGDVAILGEIVPKRRGILVEIEAWGDRVQFGENDF